MRCPLFIGRAVPEPKQPMFSVVITTFNRRDIVIRCLESCLAQTELGAQVVVVDDCSADDTATMLNARYGDRIRLVVHPQNRGINPARRTAVEHATGEWIVVVDSDWILHPNALERLRAKIERLPSEVLAVRSQIGVDGGLIIPRFMPEGVIGYEDRIRWVDEEGGWDSLHCMHQEAFARVPYIQDRRGGIEELYELDLARSVKSVYISEVLAHQYFDAGNSYLRSVTPAVVIPQLLGDAPDLLWMAENVLERHGDALRAYGPRQYGAMLKLATSRAFLAGERMKGWRYGRRTLRREPVDPVMWFTIVTGLLGPRALAYVSLGVRLLRRMR